MAEVEGYSNMTFSMFCMPGSRQLKAWPVHNHHVPLVVFNFINTILADPLASFPAANDPQFTGHTLEVTRSGIDHRILQMSLCSDADNPQYWGGARHRSRDGYARRTLTKSVAEFRQDILAIRESMVKSLKQRFPDAWESWEEGAASPAGAFASEPYRHEEQKGDDPGRHREKKEDK